MNNKLINYLVMSCIGLLLAMQTSASEYGWGKPLSYKVSITNITKNVAFTPFIVATHKSNLHFFELGQTASQAIADIAEGGNTAALAEMLSESSDVKNIANSSGLLPAGETVEIIIETNIAYRYLSLAAMLLPTNDSFIALDAVALPKFASRTYFAHAYDAGSETNDESCVSIPGPLCGGEPFSPNDDGEGFVHIASGISGEGDLSAALYDWRGPVAKIVIERM